MFLMWSTDAALSNSSIRMGVGRFLLFPHSCNYRIIGVMVSVTSWALIAPLVAGKLCSRWVRMLG